MNLNTSTIDALATLAAVKAAKLSFSELTPKALSVLRTEWSGIKESASGGISVPRGKSSFSGGGVVDALTMAMMIDPDNVGDRRVPGVSDARSGKPIHVRQLVDARNGIRLSFE